MVASEIAKKTGLSNQVVRYRLTMLRARGKVKGKLIGTTYVYPASAVKKVMNYSS